MTALPIQPTERDRERFRDLTKSMLFDLEYDRDGDDYQCRRTRAMFRLWWSVDRERQLLQNLNQSQGAKLTEWEHCYKQLAAAYESLTSEDADIHEFAHELGGTDDGEYHLTPDDIDRIAAKATEPYKSSLRSLASFVGAGGYNADKVDADVFEQKIRWGIGQIMERLEKAEAELAKLRAAPNEIGLGKGEFVIWPVQINGVHGLAFVKTDDPKVVGTSHADPEDGQIELGAGDSAIYFGNTASAMVLLERLQYVISLMTGNPVPAAPAVPEGWTEWNGGIEPPLLDGDQRDYEFLRRDGKIAAYVSCWEHGIEGSGKRDIVAYRRKINAREARDLLQSTTTGEPK